MREERRFSLEARFSRANKVCEFGLVLHVRHTRADGQNKIKGTIGLREKEKKHTRGHVGSRKKAGEKTRAQHSQLNRV